MAARIPKERRDEAAVLFQEMVVAWGRAHQTLAIKKEPRLGLSGTLLDELWKQGHDHRYSVDRFVGTYEKFNGGKYHEVSMDVPNLPPADYFGFMPLNLDLIALLESALRRLWTEATGALDSQPRFNLPTAPVLTEIDDIVAEQKARIRDYLKPGHTPDRKPNRPPEYVVVCEGTEYTLKRPVVNEANKTEIEPKTIPRKKLRGDCKENHEVPGRCIFR